MKTFQSKESKITSLTTTTIEDILISCLEKLGLAWWLEITTKQPYCIYYFGPFLSMQSATIAQPGYIEDLEQERAFDIKVVIKRCKPKALTIFKDESEENPYTNLL